MLNNDEIKKIEKWQEKLSKTEDSICKEEIKTTKTEEEEIRRECADAANDPDNIILGRKIQEEKNKKEENKEEETKTTNETEETISQMKDILVEAFTTIKKESIKIFQEKYIPLIRGCFQLTMINIFPLLIQLKENNKKMWANKIKTAIKNKFKGNKNEKS